MGYCSPGVGLAPFEVRVALAVDASLASLTHREVSWTWNGDRAVVETGRLRADLHRLSPGRYAASVRLAPCSAAASGVATAIASAIVHREGGLVLHAAGVELGGVAVLFVGPSGAGKTTASNHCPGAAWFARDRAAIVKTPRGWECWGMAGGDPVALPRAERRVLPLGAILRVRRAESSPRVERSSGVRAVTALRESLQCGGSTVTEELRRMDALCEVIGSVPVGVIETRLEAPLTPMLIRWLQAPGVAAVEGR